MNVTVHANKLLIAPRKLRAVLGGLRSHTVPQAIALMEASPRTTTEPIAKLLKASISAARDRNPALAPGQLVIAEIYCNESTRLYRSRRKSKGRTAKIAKRGSHLTLVVSWSDAAAPVAKKKTTQAATTNPEKSPKSEAKKTKTASQKPATSEKTQ